MRRKAAAPRHEVRLVGAVLAAILVCGGLSLYRSWFPARADAPASPSAREPDEPRAAGRRHPLAIEPACNLPHLVHDDELRVVLDAALPYWDPPLVATMLHAVRLWGTQAGFPLGANGQAVLSGGEMVETLLDNDLCIRRNRDRFREYLIDTPYGVRVSTSRQALSGDLLGETHVDKLLQVLGEAGVPRDAPVRTSSGRVGDVGGLLNDSLMRFSLEQEIEFTTCAFVRWLPPERAWTNRFGKEYRFDDLADALLAMPDGSGACNGVHVLFALINLHAADTMTQLVDLETRGRIEERLRHAALLLEANEVPTGGWDHRWSVAPGSAKEPERHYSERFDRIANTGHHLEWIALAPVELRPSEPVLRRAVAALVAEIRGRTDSERENFKSYWPLSHAARALVLLRGGDAFELWRKGRTT